MHVERSGITALFLSLALYLRLRTASVGHLNLAQVLREPPQTAVEQLRMTWFSATPEITELVDMNVIVVLFGKDASLI